MRKLLQHTQHTRENAAAVEKEYQQRFYTIVAEHFANGLAQELRSSRKLGRVGGQFAQQAPSPQRMHDQATRIVDGSVERLFSATQEQASGEKGRVQRRCGYQQELLSGLRARRNKEIVEHQRNKELAVRLRMQAARDAFVEELNELRRQEREAARMQA
eukprot:2059261-Rhodomonas_salina.2